NAEETNLLTMRRHCLLALLTPELSGTHASTPPAKPRGAKTAPAMRNSQVHLNRNPRGTHILALR
ncbi:hypothetical protein, partial [Pseudovibrio sp. WM33]|uniref:hypothetical protein n=1 Tax=Pseudovibrio sp. WM33 TaxID=1735585 RepID=UPI0019D3376D